MSTSPKKNSNTHKKEFGLYKVVAVILAAHLLVFILVYSFLKESIGIEVMQCYPTVGKPSDIISLISCILALAGVFFIREQVKVQTLETKRTFLLQTFDRAMSNFDRRAENYSNGEFLNAILEGAFSAGVHETGNSYVEIRSANYRYKTVASWCILASSEPYTNEGLEDTHRALAAQIVGSMESDMQVTLLLLSDIDDRVEPNRRFRSHRAIVEYLQKWAADEWDDVRAQNSPLLEKYQAHLTLARANSSKVITS